EVVIALAAQVREEAAGAAAGIEDAHVPPIRERAPDGVEEVGMQAGVPPHARLHLGHAPVLGGQHFVTGGEFRRAFLHSALPPAPSAESTPNTTNLKTR